MCWIRLTKKPQTLLIICDATRPGVPRISRLRWRWGARCQTIWRHGRRQRAYREVFTVCLATGTPPAQRAGGKSKTKLGACLIISKHSFGHTKNRCVKRALQTGATWHCPLPLQNRPLWSSAGLKTSCAVEKLLIHHHGKFSTEIDGTRLHKAMQMVWFATFHALLTTRYRCEPARLVRSKLRFNCCEYENDSGYESVSAAF